MITIGLIGKTNVGKSTFFSAATLIDVPIANRPFVTIEPNKGVGYVKVLCAHNELGVKCRPRNSICIDKYRFIPVTLVDVAGLIPGAHEGKGLGNRFLDELRRADVLLHVIDASGSTDEEGKPVPAGSYDPEVEIVSIQGEFDTWFTDIVKKDWDKFAKTVDLTGKDVVDSLLSKLSGLSINRKNIIEALRKADLMNEKLTSWSNDKIQRFALTLRNVSKPIVIVANKADKEEAKKIIERLKTKYQYVIPASAQAELALRKADKAGLIRYIPGESSFDINGQLSEQQLNALNYIKQSVLDVYGSTGVQEALNIATFNAGNNIVVYPVEDEKKYTDRNGNVLPDALIMPRGSKAIDVAYAIHTDLGEGFLYAIDVKRKIKIGADYEVNDGSIIKIVSTKASK